MNQICILTIVLVSVISLGKSSPHFGLHEARKVVGALLDNFVNFLKAEENILVGYDKVTKPKKSHKKGGPTNQKLTDDDSATEVFELPHTEQQSTDEGVTESAASDGDDDPNKEVPAEVTEAALEEGSNSEASELPQTDENVTESEASNQGEKVIQLKKGLSEFALKQL